jgi:DNA-binding winged helix-turn-helix (wHTH) protein/tetratricopeptide (TPR) repeat protein
MSHRVYRFGAFLLDPGARALMRAGEPLALPAKAFDCIVYLVEQRERAVGRDELIAAVWGKTDVSDGVLGQTILMARRALEDTGRGQSAIRTVLRFGYHWVAPTEVLEAGSEPEAAESMPYLPPADMKAGAADGPEEPEPRRRGGRRLALGIVAGARVLAGAAALAWLGSGAGPGDHAASAAAPMAVVLPVAVSDSNASSAWMRLGVMDLVAGRLRAAGQAVVPSDNVVALAHGADSATLRDSAIAQLAATAGARLVIGARAERRGEGWRVTLTTRTGHRPPLKSSADGHDVLEAARGATDALAVSLGLAGATQDDAGTGSIELDTLLEKIEAALLVDDVDTARALVDHAPPALRASPELRFQQGHIQFKSGQLDAAKASFEALMDSRPGPTDRLLRGRILNAFGAIAVQRHDPAAALPFLDQAVDLLGRAHAAAALGTTLNNRAAAHGMARDYEAALADFAQARIVLAAAGDGLGLAVSDSNLATLQMNREHYAEAAPVLDRAAARFAGFHAWDAELNARANVVLVRLALLEPRIAAATGPRIAKLVELVADPTGREVGQLARVRLLFANGHGAQAQALLTTIRAGNAGDPVVLARAQAISARQLLESGQPAAAAAEAKAAQRSLRDTEAPVDYAANWLTLLRAQLASGGIEAARKDLADAQAWVARDGTSGARLRIRLAEAAVDEAAGDDVATLAAYESALAMAGESRVPADMLAVCRPYVLWLIAQRQPSRAAVVAEHVAGWADQDFDAALVQVAVYHALGRVSAWQSAIGRARALAGERVVPEAWKGAPTH